MTATAVEPDAASTGADRGRQAMAVGRALGSVLLNAVVTLVIVGALWILFLKAFHVTPYVGKGPLDVWEYLFTDSDAATNRDEVLTLLDETLRDAAIGFVTGMCLAIALAGALVLSRTAENTIMPVAMLFRSVPLIALTPVITMIVGQGVTSVAVIGSIVVLFPALVSIVFGLRSTSRQMQDVVTVYGGSAWAALRKVAFPSALPALFAAVRISVPGAITGALIAEWLATGKGIGYGTVSAVGRAENTKVWALVVVITIVSLVLYTIAQVVESFVLARFGDGRPRGA